MTPLRALATVTLVVVSVACGGGAGSPCASGGPNAGAASLRDSASDKVRDAARVDQEQLEKLRDTKVVESARSQLEDVIKDADDQLRARATKAIDDVAAASGGDCNAAIAAPDAANVLGLVTAAIADMDKITKDAGAKVATLATPSATPSAQPSVSAPAVAPGLPSGGAPVRPSGALPSGAFPSGFPSGAPRLSGAPSLPSGGFPSGTPQRPSASPSR